MKRVRNQERDAPAAVSFTLRVERLDASGRTKARNTVRAAVTPSNAVEWTRKAGARVTPFNLQHESGGVLRQVSAIGGSTLTMVFAQAGCYGRD